MTSFINRNVLKYSLLTFCATILMYFIILVLNKTGNNQITLFFYLCTIVYSAYTIGKRDDYKRHLGFNYHLVTYLAYNTIPILLTAIGFFKRETLYFTINVLVGWTALLLLHIIIIAFVKFFSPNPQYCK